jgi:Protein of unknown function (DUF998)
MNKLRKLRNYNQAFFICWAILLIFSNYVLALKYPNYDFARDYVSLLNAVGSPVRLSASFVSIVIGVSLIGFVIYTKPFSKKNQKYAALAFGSSYILNAVIPCAKSCAYEPLALGLAHDFISLSELFTIGFLAYGIVSRIELGRGRVLALIYIIFISASAISGKQYYAGLWQRIAEASLAVYFIYASYRQKLE